MRPKNTPGAKQIAPGVYEVGDELHVDAIEICEAQGFPATPENQAVAERAVREVFGGHGVPIETRDEKGAG